MKLGNNDNKLQIYTRLRRNHDFYLNKHTD